MTKNDALKFAECMAMLSETFLHKPEISEQKVEIYFQAFQNWPIEDFQKACGNMCSPEYKKEFPTFPLPHDIHKALRGEDTASLEGWIRVKDAIGRHGHLVSVVFSDPVIHSVIDHMGGWAKVCMIKDDDYTWAEKEFHAAYQVMRKRAEHPKYVAGTHAASQQKHSGRVEIVRMGDKKLQLGQAKEIEHE